LTKKIISGGGGVWGETVMAGHPNLSTSDAADMVKYILSLANIDKSKMLPLSGKLIPTPAAKDNNKGVYILRTAYEDKGTNGLPSQKTEQTFVLRNSNVDPHAFDVYADMNKMAFNGKNLVIPTKSGASLLMKDIDLNGIKEIVLFAAAPKPQLNAAGGKVELRVGSPTGTLLGTSPFLPASDKMDFTPKMLSIPVSLSPQVLNKNQDIYFVFLNPESGNNSLMVVTGFEFVLK
jgi:cytochrome c